MPDGSLDNLEASAEQALTPERLARIRGVAAARLSGLAVAFDSLHDPHNISAALRSCEAFGVQNVHLVGSARTAPINSGVTKGCERWLTFHWHETAAACMEALHAQGFRALLTMPGDDSPSIGDVDFSAKVALVFGNEHAGVSPEFEGLADGRCHVPMFGFVESLNVSVAVAVSLAHAAAARRSALGAQSDQTPRQRDELLKAWLDRELETRRWGKALRRGEAGET